MADKDNQVTDDENAQTSADPNLVGSAAGVQDRRASRYENGNPEDTRCPPPGADWERFNDAR